MSWKVHIPESCVFWFVLLMFTLSDGQNKLTYFIIKAGQQKNLVMLYRPEAGVLPRFFLGDKNLTCSLPRI